MDLTLLGTISLWVRALGIVFFMVCMFLVFIVLLQKGKGGGLSAAFGGAGGQSAFGSKTGDVFTWVTIVVVVVFFAFAMILTMYYKPISSDEAVMNMAPVTPVSSGGGAVPITPAQGDGGTEEN